MNATWLDTTAGLGQRGRVDEVRAVGTRPGIGFIEVSGARVRVRRQPAAGKPAVVFACDGPNTLEHYDALLARLKGRADVTIVDPPGTGCSEPPPGFDFSIDAYAALMLGVLEKLDAREATLVFPCYLGFIAARAAERDAARISRLVLPQTPSWEDLRRWADRVDPRRLLRTPVLGQAVMALRRRPIARGWFKAAVADRSQLEAFSAAADEAFDAGGCFCLASLLQRWESEQFATQLQLSVPVTVCWGSKDRSHRETAADGFCRHVAGARTEVFPQQGHSVDLEAPDAFLSRVLFAGIHP